MQQVVEFLGPCVVGLAAEPAKPVSPGTVRVRTWYSGISAGTELTAYRGTNPYLNKTWDSDRRLFVEGVPTFDVAPFVSHVIDVALRFPAAIGDAR